MRPVDASNATTQSVYRLSPGRCEPSRSGQGFPVVRYIVLRAGSIAGVVQIPPPPCRQDSAYQLRASAAAVPCKLPVSVLKRIEGPNQCCGSVANQRQRTLPSCTESAIKEPRIPRSPPPTPTNTVFRYT